MEFGWEQERFYDFDSKANFAFIQTTYMSLSERARCLKMLEDVIKSVARCQYVFFPSGFDKGDIYYYIDHQSNAGEGMNTEMFKDEEQLKQFLFCPGSYIETDNDNH